MNAQELHQLGRLLREFFDRNPGEAAFVITQDSASAISSMVYQLLMQLPPERHLATLTHLADNARRVRIGLVGEALAEGRTVATLDGQVALLTEAAAGAVSLLESFRTSGY
ncbi:hypothetical protein [uncultured Phenylobacterium sp.]|uniref:hypothetical protein n=1 Tax=uncultured Phenylobacterium sp. TaxID=349273 RepID=UPI0025FAA7F8|nr:hypothetical protein [uncultured Phenylobacterium sp.]